MASSRKFAVLHSLGENWSLFVKDLIIIIFQNLPRINISGNNKNNNNIIHSLVNATILTPRKEEDDVAVNLTPIASFAIRDVLPFIRESNFEIPIKQLCSPLITPTTIAKEILDYMMNRSIRNIGIRAFSS